MQKFFLTLLSALLLLVETSRCSLSLFSSPAPLPTPKVVLVVPTGTSPTLLPNSLALTPVTPNAPTSTPLAQTPLPATVISGGSTTQVLPVNFCADARATALIDNFKKALQTSNGTLLASLVSPAHGMDTRNYRTGRVVNYDQQHARFLFDSTYIVDWGLSFGSGQPIMGSFHQVILPALLDVFNKNYSVVCNQFQVGGTTYQAAWPYAGVNFYSVYFSGTSGPGSLDWHTWLLGMEYVRGAPYLYAILQFQWEP